MDTFLLAEPAFFTGDTVVSQLNSLHDLAAVTNSIAVGIADTIIALEAPAIIANDFSKLDQLFPQRFIAGIAIGEDEEKFFEKSIPFEQCRERFEETLALVKKYWAGVPFEHSGKHFNVRQVSEDCSDESKPTVWVTARDYPTLSTAAKYAYPILPHILSEHRVVIDLYRAFTEMLERNGQDLARIAKPLVRDVFVADTSIEAERIALDAFMRLYQRHAELCELIDFKNRPKMPKACSINNILKHHLLIGDSGQVSEQLYELVSATGCDQVFCRSIIPGIAVDDAMHSVALFQNEVMPELSALMHR